MSTILVVDDLTIFCELIAASLQQAGHRAMCACSAAEATRLLEHTRPDLILLDIAMPGMDGLTFLEQLRKDEKTAHLPVILLTASADKQHVLRASKSRATDYLIKSAFSLDLLLARVTKHLAPHLAEPRPMAAASPVPVASVLQSAKAAPSTSPVIPPRMSREDCL